VYPPAFAAAISTAKAISEQQQQTVNTAVLPVTAPHQYNNSQSVGAV
jgi:hypothetical protein